MYVLITIQLCCTRMYVCMLGVDSVEVELELEKVTAVGYVDRNKVLKAVRRAGKRAEFWPYPNPPLYFTSANNYFKDTTNEFKESYNYYRHGYNVGDKHGTLPVTHRGDDKVSNMFNDDNVNACCLMQVAYVAMCLLIVRVCCHTLIISLNYSVMYVKC